MVLQPPLAEELQRVRSGRGLGQVNGASLRRYTPIGEFLSAPLPEGAQWRQVRALLLCSHLRPALSGNVPRHAASPVEGVGGGVGRLTGFVLLQAIARSATVWLRAWEWAGVGVGVW
jgi:hypothetical protein